MNDRDLLGEDFGVGEQENDLWPVFAIARWSDGSSSVRPAAWFVDHDTAEEFCRRWATEPPEDQDIAGFRRR